MPAKIFDEIAPKYVDRKGGYTRIIKIGQRKVTEQWKLFWSWYKIKIKESSIAFL